MPKKKIFASTDIPVPSIADPQPAAKVETTPAPQPGDPVLKLEDKVKIMESLLALQRYEEQFRDIVNKAKQREVQLQNDLQVAFDAAGADPNYWSLDRETFRFVKRGPEASKEQSNG